MLCFNSGFIIFFNPPFTVFDLNSINSILDTPAFEVVTTICSVCNCLCSHNACTPKTLLCRRKFHRLSPMAYIYLLHVSPQFSFFIHNEIFSVLNNTHSLSYSLLHDNIQCRAERNKYIFNRAEKIDFRSFTLNSQMLLNSSQLCYLWY